MKLREKCIELWRRHGSRRNALLAAAAALALAYACSSAASAVISSSAEGLCHSEIESMPYRHCGLLLGCARKLSNGNDNIFFRHRIDAAIKLYHAGKIEAVIVSGDNHVRSYDETTEMRDELMKGGVPAGRIVCDYAGFRTLDSVARAKEVFGQESITVISQQFHNERAIFIAKARGIDAIGFNASDPPPIYGLKVKLRESVARVRCVLDVYLFKSSPKFLGPKIAVP